MRAHHGRMDGLPAPWSGLCLHAPQLPEGVAEAARVDGGAAAIRALGLSLLRGPILAAPDWRGPWLRCDDLRWPAALSGLPGAPVALSWEGNLSLLAEPSVAIVGTRRCTSTGRGLARDYSAAVVAAGGVVVSGLAAGIDAEAHLAAGGRTIAVLGQGLAASLPGWQADLRRRIISAGGLILSEYHVDMHADIWTFPRRNRIIAGLSRGVVVVEAGHRSGAKNTAHYAMEFGREVAAVPGWPMLPSFAGCLDLVEEGCAVVRGPHSVVALLAAG